MVSHVGRCTEEALPKELKIGVDGREVVEFNLVKLIKRLRQSVFVFFQIRLNRSDFATVHFAVYCFACACMFGLLAPACTYVLFDFRVLAQVRLFPP